MGVPQVQNIVVTSGHMYCTNKYIVIVCLCPMMFILTLGGLLTNFKASLNCGKKKSHNIYTISSHYLTGSFHHESFYEAKFMRVTELKFSPLDFQRASYKSVVKVEKYHCLRSSILGATDSQSNISFFINGPIAI